MKTITLGSLFDGIGGFPLAASLLGLTPVWASEIEETAVSITRKYFPDMLHLGDITKISGSEIKPVDVITFGSPCQDLSIAGKRDGLEGERSGLFLHAVRIIYEMREATHGRYPAFIVWENVPGTFSSNGGGDFRIVLSQLTKADIPMPGFKWARAGMVRGDGIELGWRVLDAQYWGVPQRRKRIFLVGDFGGQRAGQILFERESLRGDFAEGFQAWEAVTGSSGTGIGMAGGSIAPFDTRQITSAANRSKVEYGTPCPCLSAQGKAPSVVINDQGGKSINFDYDLSPTLRATTKGHQPIIYDVRGNGDGKTVPTLTGDHQSRITDYTAIAIDCRNHNVSGVSATLQAKSSGGQSPNYISPVLCTATGQGRAGTNIEVSPTLNCNHEQPYISGGIQEVRRLTPVECERLQGFPDNWTAEGIDRNGAAFPVSDSKRYTCLGNSVAIPCVLYILSGIKNVMEE